MNGRGGASRRMRRAVSVVVALTLLAPVLSAQPAGFAADGDGEGPDLPPGVAILQSRTRLSESVPVLPANTARYFRGRYATPFGMITVYLTEADPATGLPAVDTAEPVTPACPGIDVLTHNGTLEVLPPPDSVGSGRYRLFLVPEEPTAGETGGETSGDVCAFAAEFTAAFTFFLAADADRGRELTFSGNRTPEFPAVLELDT